MKWYLYFGLMMASAQVSAFDAITTAVLSHSVYRPYLYENPVLLKSPERIQDDVYKVVLCKAHFCDETMQTIFYNVRWRRLFGHVMSRDGIKTIGYPTYDERALIIQYDETESSP